MEEIEPLGTKKDEFKNQVYSIMEDIKRLVTEENEFELAG